jgi:ribonuclease E
VAGTVDAAANTSADGAADASTGVPGADTGAEDNGAPRRRRRGGRGRGKGAGEGQAENDSGTTDAPAASQADD